jgi:hypothetical protein
VQRHFPVSPSAVLFSLAKVFTPANIQGWVKQRETQHLRAMKPNIHGQHGLRHHSTHPTNNYLNHLPMSKETLFALSLFPYLGFLWFMTKSQQTPKVALIGFYLLLVFVVVTIPAGIYAKVAFGQELANVDWLHGGAEFFLTLSNIVVVLGFSQAIRSYQRPS